MRLIYQQPDQPPLKSEYMDRLARRIMEYWEYWRSARQPLELQWVENDLAYLCSQTLPVMEGMQFINTSQMGEDDIFNGVNNLALRLSLACMPKDESWLTVVGRSNESPQLISAVQAQQIWMHRKARTRRVYGRHLKQLIVRGTSYLFLRWLTDVKYKRISTAKGRMKLRQYFKRTGEDPAIIKQINEIREPVITYQGPAVRVLDSWDVWLDPEADVLCDRRPATIVVQYMRPSDLKAAVDEDGEPMYGNLGADSNGRTLEATKVNDVLWGSPEGCARLKSLNLLGVRPQEWANCSAEVVPVYIFYAHYFEFEGKEYYDTYFHVAKSADGTQRVIRVEMNPSAEGHRLILQDQFIEFFTNVAYGISGVEKLVSAWHQKNFLAAIHLNAAAASTFPAYIVGSGILKDDIYGWNLTPGALNEISLAALGTDVIKPVPAPQMGAQLGINELQYLGKKIGGGFEATGAYGSEPVANRETATSVNFRATNQGLAIDELSEKFGDSLQELCQWAYDMNIQTAQPTENENGENVMQFGRIVGNTVQPGELLFDEWKQPRNIEVLGLHGVANKNQAIQNKNQALTAFAPMAQMMPNAPALATKLLKSLFTDLNIETDDADWLSAMELAAGNPQVQAQALQGALQNPQVIDQVMQPMQGGPPNDQPRPAPY